MIEKEREGGKQQQHRSKECLSRNNSILQIISKHSLQNFNLFKHTHLTKVNIQFSRHPSPHLCVLILSTSAFNFAFRSKPLSFIIFSQSVKWTKIQFSAALFHRKTGFNNNQLRMCQFKIETITKPPHLLPHSTPYHTRPLIAPPPLPLFVV